MKEDYDKIQKVYSIWVCLDPPENRKNSITRYALAEENLFGCVKEPISNYDLLSVIMVCLGQPDDKQNIELLRLLDVLFTREWSVEQKKQTLENEFDIVMSPKFESEVSTMGSLSQGIFNDGFENGFQKGMSKGRVEGFELGSERKQLENIRSLIQHMGWSEEQAMEALNVPKSERAKYAKLLKQ